MIRDAVPSASFAIYVLWRGMNNCLLSYKLGVRWERKELIARGSLLCFPLFFCYALWLLLLLLL